MSKDLTEGSIVKTILKTSIPLIVAFLLQSAFNIVDAFFVGKISSEALAAVSISFPVVFLIISLGAGIGCGASAVFFRFIGAKEYEHANNAAMHSIIAAVVIGILLSTLGFLAAPVLFDWTGAKGNLKAMALDYINILLLFSSFMLVIMVTNSILRGEGDMKTPMKIMGFSAILNMILDPIFIFTLGWGIRGAAMATVFSRSVGLIFLVYYMLSGKSLIKLDFGNFRYNFDYIKRVFYVGIPSALSNITMSVGMFILTVIVGFFGTDALAAFGIGFRLDAIAILPGMGISVAVISIVGQSIGAGKIERARKVAMRAGVFSSVFMSVVGIFLYAFAPQIISIFNSEPEVIEHGTSFLHIIPLSYLFVGIAMCASGAFIGSGKAVLALISTILRVIVFSVPAAYFLSMQYGYGVSGVWWGMVLGTFLGFLVTMLLFWFGGWDKSAA